MSCPRCGGLVLARAAQRTRSCPRCGHRVDLRGQRILGRADKPAQAVSLIQALKEKSRGQRR